MAVPTCKILIVSTSLDKGGPVYQVRIRVRTDFGSIVQPYP